MENLILWYNGNEKDIKQLQYVTEVLKEADIDFVRIVDTMDKIEKLTNEKAKFFFGNMPNEHYIGLDILPNKLNREWLNDIYSIIDNNLPDILITFGMVGTSFPKAEPIKK